MNKSKKVYLDYASAVSPNPGSVHVLGVVAKRKLEKARQAVANFLGALPKNIIFTSGATESNNLAIQGAVFAWWEDKKILPHIITTNIEHSSVLETFRILEKRNLAEISIMPVESNGIIDPKKIRKAIKKNTILVSVMYANNEIGTIEPIREIAKEIRHYKKINNPMSRYPLLHTDAVQATNYLDLKVEKLGVDLLSLSGSKIEDSGKVGGLFVKSNTPIVNILGGGDQEMNLRPGTENLPEILKFATGLGLIVKMKEREIKRLSDLRDYFINKLLNSKDFKRFKIILNGDRENRLPNNVNITIPKIPSDLLVIELSARGIYISEKSACHSGDKAGSYVIRALRSSQEKSLPKEEGSLRFSFGRKTKKADIDYTLKSLVQILTKLEKWYN